MQRLFLGIMALLGGVVVLVDYLDKLSKWPVLISWLTYLGALVMLYPFLQTPTQRKLWVVLIISAVLCWLALLKHRPFWSY